MKKAGLLAMCFAAAAATSEFQDIVDRINSANTSWVAQVPKGFKNMEQAKMLCGTWLKGHPNHMMLPVEEVEVPAAVPTSFDARTQWPNCSVIRTVRDQSSCGSCWAFASTEAFEDRQCIQQKRDVEMSAEDTVSCCTGVTCGLSMGCNGGQPAAALKWMVTRGVVTGGDYDELNKSVSCRPYSLPPCAHHVDATPAYPACPSQEYATPKCREVCNTGYNKTYSEDKKKGARAARVEGVAQIEAEIMNGPVAAAFTVYEDFVTYKSGVYVHKTGKDLGGHAVEIIGWGVENGEDYWLVKNSWNPTWGDNGYFKIKKGVDECGIENDISMVSFRG